MSSSEALNGEGDKQVCELGVFALLCSSLETWLVTLTGGELFFVSRIEIQYRRYNPVACNEQLGILPILRDGPADVSAFAG